MLISLASLQLGSQSLPAFLLRLFLPCSSFFLSSNEGDWLMHEWNFRAGTSAIGLSMRGLKVSGNWRCLQRKVLFVCQSQPHTSKMTKVDRAEYHPPNPVILMSIIQALTDDAEIGLLNSPHHAPPLLCLLTDGFVTAEAQTTLNPFGGGHY